MKLPPEHFQVEVTPQQSTRFGEKLMKQMGWEKGQGLGKEGTGRKEHIRVKKKDNTEGVGAGANWNWGVKWWEQVFDEQAEALLQRTSAKPESSTAKNDSSPSAPAPAASPASELEAARQLEVSKEEGPARVPKSAGERLGVRVQPDVSRKRQRRESKHKTGRCSPGNNQQHSQAPAEGAGRQATAAGTTSAACSTDQIFGRQWSALEPVKPSGTAGEATAFPAPEPAWWGAKRFVAAGRLHGVERTEKASARQKFSEQDQTTLYNQLHSAQASGKGGLGKSSAPPPGVLRKSQYAGSHTGFDDDSSAQLLAPDTSNPEPVPRIKYKKLVSAVLLQAPNHAMKRSKLERRVYRLIAQHHGEFVATQCRQQAALAAQVSKSRQFVIMDNVVSLVAA